jgi:UDP-glucose 4-epimerase
MAAGCRRAPAGSFTAISIRPSWCQNASNIARNLGPLVRDASLGNEGLWSYICCADLAEACVAAAATDRVPPNTHEVVYIAAADNAGGRDLAAAVKAYYGEGTIPQKGALPRVDASGINCAKAARLLGWTPKLSWRDFLDATTGELKPADQLPKEY